MDKEISREENLEKLADQEALEKSGVEFAPEKDNKKEKEPLKEIEELKRESPREQPVATPASQGQGVPQTGEEVLAPEAEKEIEEVEDILEEDLAAVYKELDVTTKKTFKVQGEETAKQIVVTIHKVKHHTKKIIKLISKWLRIIPGINKFFVEQEAKIKTDKIEEEIEHQHDQK